MTSEQAFQGYLDAILAGDRRAATEIVRLARDAGIDYSELYMRVFQPALQEIGRLWQANEISVADEHLATAITQAAMSALFDEAASDAYGVGPALIAACADVEQHEIGLRMLCDLLELDGWTTHYLGASVPIGSLVEMIRRRTPEVVALSTSISLHLPRLRAMVEAVRGCGNEPPPLILVGGRPFLDQPELALELGADLTAPDAASAVRLLQDRFSA
jgi:MerR family transcriptional regulator, light-induced transcriptional regulator